MIRLNISDGKIAMFFCIVLYRDDNLLICPDCLQEHSKTFSFCTACGARLIPVVQPQIPACPHCGEPIVPDDAKFCGSCGTNLNKEEKKKGFF